MSTRFSENPINDKLKSIGAIKNDKNKKVELETLMDVGGTNYSFSHCMMIAKRLNLAKVKDVVFFKCLQQCPQEIDLEELVEIIVATGATLSRVKHIIREYFPLQQDAYQDFIPSNMKNEIDDFLDEMFKNLGKKKHRVGFSQK
jgi:hypothetical protein